MPLIIRIVLCLVVFAGSARANDAFRLSFEGLYESRMTWRPAEAGTEFHQSGGLSLRPAGKADWRTFKTWENVFTRVVPGP
jgi:hypothetical protein